MGLSMGVYACGALNKSIEVKKHEGEECVLLWWPHQTPFHSLLFNDQFYTLQFILFNIFFRCIASANQSRHAVSGRSLNIKLRTKNKKREFSLPSDVMWSMAHSISTAFDGIGSTGLSLYYYYYSRRRKRDRESDWNKKSIWCIQDMICQLQIVIKILFPRCCRPRRRRRRRCHKLPYLVLGICHIRVHWSNLTVKKKHVDDDKLKLNFPTKWKIHLLANAYLMSLWRRLHFTPSSSSIAHDSLLFIFNVFRILFSSTSSFSSARSTCQCSIDNARVSITTGSRSTSTCSEQRNRKKSCATKTWNENQIN